MTPEDFELVFSRHSGSLQPRREARLDEFFRNELLDATGEVVIGQSRFHPADVLQMMKPEEHDQARTESKQRYNERIGEFVSESFPSPIARPFDSFVNGPREPLRRLYHMKDTWEGIVGVAYCMILAECAERGIRLEGVLVRTDDNSTPRRIRRGELLDWRIATRLGVIEGVLIYAEHHSINLACAAIVPIGVISEMRRLNSVRNEFSHSQTRSDRQALSIIEECRQDLLDILGDLEDLTTVEMFRVDQVARNGGGTLEVENLAGYAGARRIRELRATPDQILSCVSRPSIQNFNRTLIKMGSDIWDASPFFYCSDDISGHRTRLHIFKQHKPSECKVTFEVVAEGETIENEDTDFIADLNRIKDLVR